MEKPKLTNKMKVLLNIILILVITLSISFLGAIEKFGLNRDAGPVQETKVSSSSLSQEPAVIYKAATQTNSYNNGLALEIGLTRGGKVLEEGGEVYEGEYIKYNFKVTNNTEEDMENVKITSTIPDGVEYGELQSNFEEARQPYYYEYDEEKAETEIVIENIPAGESKNFYYEVHVKDLQDEEQSKEIQTDINAYVGEQLASTYEVKNIIKPADVQLFLGSFTEYSGIHYILLIKSENEDPVDATIHFPSEFELQDITELQGFSDIETYYEDDEEREDGELVKSFIKDENGNLIADKMDIDLTEDKQLTATFKANSIYTFYGHTDNVIDFKNSEYPGILTSYAEVKEKGYVSNENRLDVGAQNIEISMTSNKEGQELNEGDDLEYTIIVKNTGKRKMQETVSGRADYVSINVTDFLPEGIQPISMTYDNWKIRNVERQVQNSAGNGMLTLTSEEVYKDEDMVRSIPSGTYDENGNKLADIDIPTLIVPRGETVNIKITAKALGVYEETKIENSAKASGEEIEEKTTNKVENTILPMEIVGSDEPVPDEPTVVPPPSASPSPSTTPSVTPSVSPSPSPSVKPQQSTVPPSNVVPNVADPGTTNGTCDFEINKYITKVTVQTVNGTKEYSYNDENLVKTEIRSKEMDGAVVTIDYKIVVRNVGQASGIIEKVVDYLPSGLTYVANNSNWKAGNSGELTNQEFTNTILAPGRSVELTLTAKIEMTSSSTGTYRNKVNLVNAKSTGGKSDTSTGNNNSNADIVISVSTGEVFFMTLGIIGAIVALLLILYIVTRKKIDYKKLLKRGKTFALVLALIGIVCVPQISFAIHASAPPGGTVWDLGGGVTGYCTNKDLTNPPECELREQTPPSKSGPFQRYVGICRQPWLHKNSEDVDVHYDGSKQYLVFGPMQYSSKYCDRFSVSAYDIHGAPIGGVSAQPMPADTDGAISSFVVYIPKENCANGVSKIALDGSGERWDEYYNYYIITRHFYGDPADNNGQTTSQPVESSYSVPAMDIQSTDPIPLPNTYTPVREYYHIEWSGKINFGLEIVKEDKDTYEDGVQHPKIKPLPNVQFQITGPNCNRIETTDQDGKIYIDNLLPGNYTIKELDNPNYGYFAELAPVTNDVTVKGQWYNPHIVNEKQTGCFGIEKKNTDSKNILEGFLFKLKDMSGNYVQGLDENGNPIRRATGNVVFGGMRRVGEAEATEFVIGEDGKVRIHNILMYETGMANANQYEVVEVYERNQEYFDGTDLDYIQWTLGGATHPSEEPMIVTVSRGKSYHTIEEQCDNILQILIENRQKYIDLTGYVWEEGLDGKVAIRNGKYDGNEPDHLVSHVSVRLVDKTTGEVVINKWELPMEQRTGEEYPSKEFQSDGQTDQVVDVTRSNEQGYFKFEKVEIDKLKDYSIEFSYNGLSYQCVDPGDAKAEKTSKAVETGSSTSSEDRQTFNNKFTEVTHNNSTGVADQKYDFYSEHYSELNYEGEYAYGWECATHGDNRVHHEANQGMQWFPINDIREDYMIWANSYDAIGGIDNVKSPEEIRVNEIELIEELDLGIYQREQPDIAITQDLQGVRLVINEYNHVYIYGGKSGETDPSLYDYANNTGYGVQFYDKSRYADPNNPYQRPIYNSDYVWKDRNVDESLYLTGYLTYKVTLKNQSSNLTSIVNYVDDYYDPHFESDVEAGSLYNEATGKIEGNMGNFTSDSEMDGYKHVKIDLGNIIGEIANGEESTFYVTLTIKREHIEEMVRGAENLNNVVEIGSYGTKMDGNVYAGIDEDSNPGSLLAEQKPSSGDIYEDDTDKAPPIKLTNKENRSLEGNVFEDITSMVTDPGTGRQTREGDGLWQEGSEPPIDNVQVTLYKVSDKVDVTQSRDYGKALETDGAEVAMQWGDNHDLSNGDQAIVPATGADGHYYFDGYIPDVYILEYKWGDEDYPVIKYKATIYADENHEMDYWPRDGAPDIRKQDAYDDWQTRLKIDKVTETLSYDSLGAYEDSCANDKMYSRTNAFVVPEEYEDKKVEYTTDMSQEGQIVTYPVKNIDFGIARRPIQSIKLEKTIEHIKLTLENGDVHIDTDVTKDAEGSSHFKNPPDSMKDVPGGKGNKAHPEGQLSIESDQILQAGATLDVTYGINVTNTGEVDYVNEAYDRYGIAKSSPTIVNDLVKINPARINDYTDTEWNIPFNNGNEDIWQEWSIEELAGKDTPENGKVHPNVYGGENPDDTLIKQRLILSTDIADKDHMEGLTPGQSLRDPDKGGVIELKTLKLLSSSRADMLPKLVNEAEVTYITKTGGSPILNMVDDEHNELTSYTGYLSPGDFVPGSGFETENDDGKAQIITITGDTGENLEYVIPTMIGIAVFAILAGGVTFIKKEVLGDKE